VLGQAEIDELPDDPDQMEQVLKDMAGPGSVLRVNGFRGGRMPPKDQIAQIRFRRNMFAADAHEPGFMAVDILTRPGLDSWRGSTSLGFRDDVLSARNAFAPAKGDERNGRFGYSLVGDMNAQVAACRTGEARFQAILDRFGYETYVAAREEIYRQSEVLEREAVAAKPTSRSSQKIGPNTIASFRCVPVMYESFM
jgi:hypothetical protein